MFMRSTRSLHLLRPNPLGATHVVVTAQEQRHGDQRQMAISADAQIGPHPRHVQAGQHALVGRCCLHSTEALLMCKISSRMSACQRGHKAATFRDGTESTSQ